MKKPNQIRKALEESNPFFVQNPDSLQLYTDGGQVICTGAKSLSYEYRYTLNIIVTDYADDIARIIVPVLAYLRVNQPELFENPQRRENGFKFITDYNNNDTLDLSIEIQLTERVVQKTAADGDAILQYEPEPTWDEPESIRVYLETEENLILESKK